MKFDELIAIKIIFYNFQGNFLQVAVAIIDYTLRGRMALQEEVTRTRMHTQSAKKWRE